MRSRRLPATIYALLVGNLLALWLKRDVFVNGWDLFGVTFGVLAFGEGSFGEGVARIWDAFLHQKARPVFTGGESFIYGMIPGLLNHAIPWLLWSELLNLVIFVLLSIWLARRLGYPAWVYWACVLASPALMSLSIIGLAQLPSTVVPYGLAVAYVLSRKHAARGAIWGTLVDVLAFAAITLVALNGYESGKTFFVVPAVAALTVTGVSLVRRASWLGCALAINHLMSQLRPMATDAYLATIPRTPGPFLMGVLKFAKRYVVDWYIDFPALGFAAVIALLVIREQRWFWRVFFLAVLGLVSLSAFHFEGAFLVPHRFTLLAFVSALIVSSLRTEGGHPRLAERSISVLLAAGIAYTTYTTVRFVLEYPENHRGRWNHERVYPLPYNRAQVDGHIWRDRIRDAKVLVDVIKQGTEPHVFFYGFSVEGEDSVNPQLIVSRYLLPLGYEEFSRRLHFFDHFGHMYFQFPIKPLTDVLPEVGKLPTPFYVHVREPEYDVQDVIARYFNNARVTPIDLGLYSLRSFRVDEWASPGPIPIRPLAQAQKTGGAPGFCVTTWEQNVGEYSPLRHPESSLSKRISFVTEESAKGGAPYYENPGRRRSPTATQHFDRSAVAVFTAQFDNATGAPMPIQVSVSASDEVALTINDQVILESLSWKPPTDYVDHVILAPGPQEVKLLFHTFWKPGDMSFSAIDADGRPIPWTCDAR